MKRPISIILLTCLLLSLTGSHLFFFFQRMEIKAEMKKMLKSGISREQLTVFSISLNDKEKLDELEWEGDDEFKFNGEMYDVVEQKEVNGKLVIYCISDEKETALVKKYERLNNESQHSKNKKDLLVKLFSSSYIQSPMVEGTGKMIVPLHKPVFNTGILSFQNSEVLTPPPQVA